MSLRLPGWIRYTNSLTHGHHLLGSEPEQRNFGEISIVGKGDKRTKRGKIFKGSFGKSRPKGKKKPTAAASQSGG
jgi:30S ribosomal protein S31